VSWADEFIVLVMVKKDMAHVLAEETLDAFPEFLDSVNVSLAHVSGAVRVVGLPGGERLDRLLALVVEGHIGAQVAYPRECTHRFNGHGFIEVQVREPLACPLQTNPDSELGLTGFWERSNDDF